MKRGYSDRLAELEVRLMNQERSTGSGNDVVNYARERRKMFIAVKDPGRAWTRNFGSADWIVLVSVYC